MCCSEYIHSAVMKVTAADASVWLWNMGCETPCEGLLSCYDVTL